jgi:hypothetical protein
MSDFDDGDLTPRAIRVHYRRCKANGWVYDQPAKAASGEEEVDGVQYVVLRNVNGILAVYRICKGDKLKRLETWPQELETIWTASNR